VIAHLNGTVLSVSTSRAVISVAGVGYLVWATPSTLGGLRPGAPTELFTHLVVREDALTLFGFATAHERDTFDSLQAVSGVGPKLALSLLAVHSPDSLAAAVASGDGKALERVPGVGAKVAARLLLELGGKVRPSGAAPVGGAADARSQVVDALVGLGWQAKAAEAAVQSVTGAPIADAEVGAVLRAALKALGGTRG